MKTQFIQRLSRDPLFRFFLGGLIVFALYSFSSSRESDISYRITFDEGQIERLKSAWAKEKGRIPTKQELTNLLTSEIEEEALYREARRLGLDKGDRIVKRRLVQKYRVMLDDVVIVAEPDELLLKEYYLAHLERYQQPAIISFEHLFFANSNRVDPQGDAVTTLLKLMAQRQGGEGAHLTGDSFLGPLRLDGVEKRQLDKIFGSGFYAQLMVLDAGAWSTPVESAYGWHLIYMHDLAGPEQSSFSMVRDQVLADWRQAERLDASTEMLDQLFARYEIETSTPLPETFRFRKNQP